MRFTFRQTLQETLHACRTQTNQPQVLGVGPCRWLGKCGPCSLVQFASVDGDVAARQRSTCFDVTLASPASTLHRQHSRHNQPLCKPKETHTESPGLQAAPCANGWSEPTQYKPTHLPPNAKLPQWLAVALVVHSIQVLPCQRARAGLHEALTYWLPHRGSPARHERSRQVGCPTTNAPDKTRHS